MLSRTADNLYWLSRYVERAEYLARILDVTQRMTALPLTYGGSTNEWETALATAGCTHAFFAVHSEANEETVADFICFSPRQSVLDPKLHRKRQIECARSPHRADRGNVGRNQRYLAGAEAKQQ